MISYEVYKIIHILGIMVLFLSLGALFFTAFNGIELSKKQKRPWMIAHGVSLFFILLGGFGLLARLGMASGFPLWVWVKLIVWAVFGGVAALLIRKPKLSKMTLSVTIALGFVAVYFANYKPFM